MAALPQLKSVARDTGRSASLRRAQKKSARERAEEAWGETPAVYDGGAGNEDEEAQERPDRLMRTAGKTAEVGGKATSAAGTATKAAGTATQAAGMGTQAAGAAVETAGKGIGAVGKGASAVGKALTATKIGAIVGVPLQALGIGAQAGGKATQGVGRGVRTAGKGVTKAGRAASRTGQRMKTFGQQAQTLGRATQEEAGKPGGRLSGIGRAGTLRMNQRSGRAMMTDNGVRNLPAMLSKGQEKKATPKAEDDPMKKFAGIWIIRSSWMAMPFTFGHTIYIISFTYLIGFMQRWIGFYVPIDIPEIGEAESMDDLIPMKGGAGKNAGKAKRSIIKIWILLKIGWNLFWVVMIDTLALIIVFFIIAIAVEVYNLF